MLWNSLVDYVLYAAMLKATRLIDFLQQNLCNCSKKLKELSYKQFVLPVLEYASCHSSGPIYHLCNISIILNRYSTELLTLYLVAPGEGILEIV